MASFKIPPSDQEDSKTINGIGATKPNIAELMSGIRQRIKEDITNNKDPKIEFRPAAANLEGQEAKRADEIVNSEELRNLNRSYTYSARLDLNSITSHRPGFFGNLIVKLKRRVLRVLWESILKDYLTSEKEFQTNLVRFLNDISKYIGAKDSSIFWELIRKIDYDVGKSLDRIERINDQQTASQLALERRVDERVDQALRDIQKGGRLDRHEAQLNTLESVVRGMESIVSKLKVSAVLPPTSETPAAERVPSPVPLGDFSYLLLENRYRGSDQAITQHLRVYPPYFEGAKLPVLEIGSGRGELQNLLRQAEIASYGVDMDPAMVATCLAQNLDVKIGNGLSHLRSVRDRSLGGVIAVQVVEHLQRQELEELFRLAAAKVAVGGRVIFETINPRSLLALTSNYFRDPTHVWPLHPDTLEYCASLAGLKVIETRMLSPVAAAGQLQEIPLQEDMAPRMLFALQTFNSNIKQLNQWLYGQQDYCIVAEAQ